jgi:hypothetical protein
MLEEMTLGEMLEGAGAAAGGALGTGAAIAAGVVGALTGGVTGLALVFGAGFLVGRRMRSTPKRAPETGTAKPINVER